MTKQCALCAKTNITGRRIQHHHSTGWRYKAPKTNRVFKANLRKIDLEVGNEVIRTDICMKCYKKLRKEAK